MSLTSRKKKFAQAKLSGLTNKEAAIASGLSAKTASAAGSRLIKDPDVQNLLVKGRSYTINTSVETPVETPSIPKDPALPGRLILIDDGMDMLTLLQGIARGKIDATTEQVRAAIAAVQYTHPKKGESGKKEDRTEKAKDALKGRFAPKSPPKLVINNR